MMRRRTMMRTLGDARKRRAAVGLFMAIAVSGGGSTFAQPPTFVPPDAAEIAQRTSWTGNDKVIGTSYFYWYRWPDQHFFDDANYTDDALTDHFVAPKSVSFDSKAWHKNEASDMIEAGIDVLWPVYWAAPGVFDHPVWGLFVTGLLPLQEALDELVAEGKTPPKVGMFYDTSSIQNAMPPDGAADLTTPEGKEVFYGTIRSFFATVRPRHWACIDGRPIVVLYAAGFAEDYDQSTFAYLDAQFAAEFDGLTPYIIRERSWNAQTDSDYRWGAALHGPFLDGIASIGAGYDDTAVPGRGTPIRWREDGDFYRYNWLGVLRSSAKIVHVETWNEMHEGTEICESVEYGRQYIELTTRYAAHFKAGTIPDEEVVLEFPNPEPRPPDMEDGIEYADVREVHIRAAGGEMTTEGIDYVGQADGTLAVVEHLGHTYLRTETDFEHRYAYLALKNPFYYDQRRRSEVVLEYLDEGSARVELQYDSYNPAGTFDGSYTSTGSFRLTNSGSVKTHTFGLEDARFANRQNGGSDFRFYIHNGPLFIQRVSVRLLDLPAPVLAVTALEPAPGTKVSPAVEAITATFSTNVQLSSVRGRTFRLVGSGGDGVFGNDNDLAIAARAIGATGRQARFEPAGDSLPPDDYQVTLVGRGAKPIVDTRGHPLDGKFDGTFPSGDSIGARDFNSTFVVGYALGDFDSDGDVDLHDFGFFQACMTGPYRALPNDACRAADFNDDGHVDEGDFGRFSECLSGANVSADLNCSG